MSAISEILKAEQNKVEIIAANDQNAKAEAQKRADDMAQRLAKLAQENPDMTVVEFQALCLGAMKVSNYRAVMKALMSSARMLGIKEVSPFIVPLKAEIAALQKEAVTVESKSVQRRKATQKAK
jgi:hypothetical protein